MIKAVAKRDGKPLLILGLSRRNTELLLQKKPIVIKPSDVFMGDDFPTVFIFADETEADLEKTVKAFIGPMTLVHDQTKPSS